MRVVKIGIVGCGNISKVYIQNLETKFNNTKVVALCDIDIEKARNLAQEYNIDKVLSFEEMLNDEEVEIVVNLTIPQQHYALSKAAIEAGKNVYSEKPLALNYEQAKELVELAQTKNVMLGCAPDTFLGAGYQTVRKVIDSGLIGDVVSMETFDLNHGHENWHPSPEFFYEAGGGPDYDRGPYNFTALVTLFGPVSTVAGMTTKAFEERTITSAPKFGEKIEVKVPTHISGVMKFENGAVCVAVFSFDAWGTKLPHAEIHGTLGSLIVPDANSFTGDVLYKSYLSDDFEKIPHTHGYEENDRGLGLSDMAQAILEGRKPRASGETACHVVEIMEGLHKSSSSGEYYTLDSKCVIPEPLPMGLIEGFID